MAEQPINVTYLLAVWGESYIRQFMELSLRSLLAPGNIPGLAAHTRSKFIFLTREADRGAFDEHPMFARLSEYCRVEFVAIDDLIFHGNYSATLTMAYERGMRQAGSQMLSTYFIYLVGDYIMADGSLLNLLPHMQRGVSGITAGNFQVVEEDVTDIVKSHINPATGVLAIPPRALVALSLAHLHPLTMANTVTQPYSHTAHTNRLFWQVNKQTLLGRFYLRHMLCIRPESDNYVIGASCDYSFITEMCPSGNVVHIADSDEYYVVEMQPFTHEQYLIQSGPFSTGKMASELGKWLTRPHRENIAYPVLYHADDIPSGIENALEESRNFVAELERLLPQEAKPVRGHPYWRSCIEGILRQLTTVVDEKLPNTVQHFRQGVFAGIVGSPVFEPPLGASFGDDHLLRNERYQYDRDLRQYAKNILRNASKNPTRIWHREYAIARTVLRALRETDEEAAGTWLLVACQPTEYAAWCRRRFEGRVLLQHADLFCARDAGSITGQANNPEHAVLLLPTTHMRQLGHILEQCRRVGSRRITLIVTQPWFIRQSRLFRARLATLAAYYGASDMQIESFLVLKNPTRGYLDLLYRRCVGSLLRASFTTTGILKRFSAIALLPFVMSGYALGNLLSRKASYPNLKNATCAVIQLKVSSS